jgi:hypothetical protein
VINTNLETIKMKEQDVATLEAKVEEVNAVTKASR